MKTFEYLRKWLSPDYDSTNTWLADELNHFGAEGWEVILMDCHETQHTGDPGSDVTYGVLFKREVEQ